MYNHFAVAGMILIVASVSSAQAQVMLDASKINCDQFVHSKVAPTRSIAAWLSGFYHGRRIGLLTWTLSKQI